MTNIYWVPILFFKIGRDTILEKCEGGVVE